MDYTITGLSVADTDAISTLHGESFARAWTGGEFEKLLNDQAVLALGLRSSERAEPVAFLLIRTVPVAGEAEILTFVVAKARQKRGLGYKLLDHALRQLSIDGLEALFLEVDEGNESACKLYNRLGFETVGERKGYYQSDDTDVSKRNTALVMKLQLR